MILVLQVQLCSTNKVVLGLLQSNQRQCLALGTQAFHQSMQCVFDLHRSTLDAVDKVASNILQVLPSPRISKDAVFGLDDQVEDLLKLVSPAQELATAPPRVRYRAAPHSVHSTSG